MKCEESTKEEENSSAIVLTIGIVAQQGKRNNVRHSFDSLMNNVFVAGANFFPKHIPGRIALLQIILFNLIIYYYYSGSIVSARLSEPLDMMEDDVTVLADSELRIAAEAVPYLNYFLYVRIFFTEKIHPRIELTRCFTNVVLCFSMF